MQYTVDSGCHRVSKDAKQTDQMLDAPSAIDFEQMHELHIKAALPAPDEAETQKEG